MTELAVSLLGIIAAFRVMGVVFEFVRGLR